MTYKYEKQALSTAIFLLGVFSVITTSAVAQLRSSPVGKSHNATTTAVKEASWQFPLHEQSGTQHVHVWIGDPPSRQTWIVDTGSRFSATACEGCRDCGVHANRYLPTTSSASSTRIPHQCSRGDAHVFDKMEETSSGFNEAAVVLGCHMADRCVRNKCEINQQYTEGSTWTAVEVNDIVALGEEHLYEATWDGAFMHSFNVLSIRLECPIESIFLNSHRRFIAPSVYPIYSRGCLFIWVSNRSKRTFPKTICRWNFRPGTY